jgi:hypothetical protein
MAKKTKASKARDRELYGPSTSEVVLGATLSLLLGAVLAGAFLIAKPVEKVRVLPDEPVHNQVYYIEGAKSGGNQWLRKKQIFVEDGAMEIELSENELNRWIASTKAKPETAEAPAMIAPREVNFRFVDNALQIGMPTELNIPMFTHSIIVQASGNFELSGDQYELKLDRLMVGSLAVHRIPVLSSILADRLLASQEVGEEISSAWESLSVVAIEDNKLSLERL